ncbi:MAG: DNA/RNA non-specific endonuclease, partial [Gammaproteobacteria bacterium]|nr:DNA/RNA non-specific endonuclease [Gammaproteobacteria bacterium]
VKRLSPGRVSGINAESFIFSHDCTTLGGNSGSALIRPATGEAVGLHFSGSFLDNNFAVTSVKIQERLHRLGDNLFVPGSSPLVGDRQPGVVQPSDEAEVPTADELGQRTGYDADFLGAEVSLPGIAERISGDIAYPEPGAPELKYTNFSVCMHAKRKFAAYTACNIDGGRWFHIPRQRDRWFYDPRLDRAVQVGNELYRNNKLQRGHLVRRLDPAWGDDREQAEQAIKDTYFWTNCTPQHERFNPRSWLELERYVLDNAIAHELKVSVFTGPVFRDTDKSYRDHRIPEDYWKVLAIVRADTGQLSVTAYLLSQSEFVDHLEFVYGGFHTYQVPLNKILELTGIEFTGLSRFDPLSRIESIPFVEIHSGADLVL